MKILDFLQKYFWVIGLGLIVGGLTQSPWKDEWISLLVAGVIVMLVGIFISDLQGEDKVEKESLANLQQNTKKTELIRLRKLYLTQWNDLESKILFYFFTIVLSISISYSINLKLSLGITAIILGVLLMIGDALLENQRKRMFNDLIEDIKENRVGIIK